MTITKGRRTRDVTSPLSQPMVVKKWRYRALWLIMMAVLMSGVILWVQQLSIFGKDSQTTASVLSLRSPSAKIDDRREVILFRFKSDIVLSPEIIEALTSSVTLPLIFEYDLSPDMPSQWRQRQVLARGAEQVTLRYNTLLEQYVVTHTQEDAELPMMTSFPSLSSALQFLVSSQTYALFLAQPLPVDGNNALLLNVRLRLDVEGLPAPLQPYAFSHQGWQLDSGWISWPVKL